MAYDVTAQEKDSRGKDFWFTFIPNLHTTQNSPLTDSLYIYISASEPTSGVLRYRGRNGNWQSVNFDIPDPTQVFKHRVYWLPYELQGDFISAGQNAIGNQVESVVKNVFHVTSDKEVSVYALNQASTTSDAFLVLPTDALGKDYIVLTYNSDNPQNGDKTPSQFAIVATEDNTDITINPSAPTSKNGIASNIIVKLNQGETFLVQADNKFDNGFADLTGSRVQSSRPVALFAGQMRARIPIKDTAMTSRDHIVEQIPSIDTWGRTAIVVPFPKPDKATNLSQDIYRVLAAYDSTDIMINGVKTTTLSTGGMYQSILTTPQVISSNKSILVAQYKKTSGDTASSGTDYNGDPFMMLVPPSDQFQDNYRYVSIQALNVVNGSFGNKITIQQGYAQQFTTIVMPNSAVANTRLDGQLVELIAGSNAVPIPGTNFSYIWVRVGDGVHTVTSSERVGIYVYGYGRANSYGYVGGMSFRSFDFNPPQITGAQSCTGYLGAVYDTVAGDSRIVRIFEEPGSAKNIESFTYNLIPPQDSVIFKIGLKDPNQDGEIKVTAIDSVLQKTTLPIRIKGFTVSSTYKLQNNDSIQQFKEKTPVGKRVTYLVTLENYGSFNQIIKPSMWKGIGSAFTIIGPTPLTLKPKEQFTYQISYDAAIEGNVFDSLFIENECTTKTMALFDITAFLDKQKPLISAKPDSCGTCHLAFISDSLATDGGLKDVTISSSKNINWTTSFPNTQAIRALNICVIDVNKDAMYEIRAEDKNGNVSFYYDTIPGFTIQTTSPSGIKKVLGGIPIGSLYCDSITLFNTGLYEQVVDQLRLSKNTVFSVPKSILPLRIAPGKSATVLACYAPIDIIDTMYETKRDRDTIFIGRSCVSLPFIYEAFGTKETLISNGKCDVTIKSSIVDLSMKKIANIGIAPHPILHGSQSRLTFSMQASAQLRVKIIEPMSGREEQMFMLNSAPAGDYSVDMDMKQHPPGTYVIVITSDNAREIIPCIIAD